ncbi:MAG: hypothetical protein V1859_02445 [archaeon]
MARRTKEKLLIDILDQLKQRESSINDLVKDSNWSTIRDAVYLLKELGLVDIREEKNAQVCSLKKGVDVDMEGTVNSNTLFKIPITEEQNNLFSFVFSEIKKKFIEKWNREPKTTEAEKIAAEVIYDMKLNLPIGWYLHGMIPAKKYETSQIYVFKEPVNHKEINKEIHKKIEEYGKYQYINDLIRAQYKKHQNKLYQIKEELKKIIMPSVDLNNLETKTTLLKFMRHLLFELPRKEDASELCEIVNNYVSIMDEIFLSSIDLNQYKVDLFTTFESIWQYIATYNFFDSLAEYYDRIILYRYFYSPLESAKDVAVESVKILADLCPPLKEMPELNIESDTEEIIRKSYQDMQMTKEQ